MKDFKDMDFTERLNWATGMLTIAIGEGKFRDGVYNLISMVNQDAWERGMAEGEKRAKVQEKK